MLEPGFEPGLSSYRATWGWFARPGILLVAGESYGHCHWLPSPPSDAGDMTEQRVTENRREARVFLEAFKTFSQRTWPLGWALEDEFLPGRERFWKNCPRHVNGQKRWCVVLPRDAEWHTVGRGWDLWLVSYWSGYLHCEGVNNFRKTESHKWFLFIKIKVLMFSKDTIDFYPVQMWWL